MNLNYLKLKRALINSLPIREKKRRKSIPPFFIIGSGRNGSTLLATILNNHPAIFIPPEQYALPHIIFNWHYKFYPSWEKKLNHNINYFFDHAYHWKTTRIEAFTFLYQHLEKNASLIFFLEALHKLEGVKNDKDFFLWGDKTPYNTFYVPLILKLYPDAKFIFLNRDPRDFIASSLKMNATLDLSFLIYRWEKSLDMYEYLQTRQTKILSIQYESFVQNPEQMIQETLLFLINKKQENILENYASNTAILSVENSSNHQNIQNRINTDSIGKYKTLLSKKDIMLIEQKLKKHHRYFFN